MTTSGDAGKTGDAGTASGERGAVIEEVCRHLDWQVESGGRYVIDAGLREALAEERVRSRPPLKSATVTASPLVGGSPPPATGPSPRSLQSAGERLAGLEGLEHKALDCTRCPLHTTRTQVVFGAGNPDADLMFIGEAPGRDEDLEGVPFVGRAGQLLTRIIEAIKLKRSDVYIANVLKCRPPENRNPNSAEIALCSPFLYEQIEWVAPKVICALGRFACMTLLKSSSALGAMRGRVHEFQGVPVVVTYHPAALLRYEKLKRPTWADMQAVQKILAGEMPRNWAK
jgi:uracil-DNA glycosylase family 4